MTTHTFGSLGSLPGWMVARLTLLGCVVVIGGALFIEHVLGYPACKLCYQQRVPYYVAMAVAAALSFPRVARALPYGPLALALVFVAGAGLAGHHVGVEAGLWAGPTDCSGAAGAMAPSVADFMSQLAKARVANCAEPALRIFGLSLSAWNLVISAVAAGALGYRALRRRIARDVQGLGVGSR